MRFAKATHQKRTFETLSDVHGEIKMAKLVRGKVIVEKRSEEVTSSPFASKEAPWVGAEQAWRNGIVPPPHEEASAYLKQPMINDYRGLELTENELETVLSSLPPAPNTSTRLSWVFRLLPYTAATGVLVGTIWMAPRSRDATRDAADPTPVKAATALTAGVGRVEEVAFEAMSVADDQTANPAGIAVEKHAAVINPPTQNPSTVPAKGSRGASKQTVARQKVERMSGRVSILALKSTVDDDAGNQNKPSKIDVESVLHPEEISQLSEADSPNARETETLAEAAIGSMGEVLRLAVTAPKASNSSTEKRSSGASPDALLNKSSNAIPSATIIETVKSSIAPVVARCNTGVSGRVVVALEVKGTTGRVVSTTLVEHGTAGINAGRCVARAARLAKFPPFKNRRYRLEYAFDI
jgi:hypothetical protein